MSRLAALALAGVLLSGCEAHFSLGSSSPELAKAKLEAGLKDAITEKTGVTLTSVSCDGPLKGSNCQYLWIGVFQATSVSVC